MGWSSLPHGVLRQAYTSLTTTREHPGASSGAARVLDTACDFEWLENKETGECTDLHDWATAVSSIFVLATVFLSCVHIRQHVRRSKQPQLRK